MFAFVWTEISALTAKRFLHQPMNFSQGIVFRRILAFPLTFKFLGRIVLEPIPARIAPNPTKVVVIGTGTVFITSAFRALGHKLVVNEGVAPSSSQCE